MLNKIEEIQIREKDHSPIHSSAYPISSSSQVYNDVNQLSALVSLNHTHNPQPTEGSRISLHCMVPKWCVTELCISCCSVFLFVVVVLFGFSFCNLYLAETELVVFLLALFLLKSKDQLFDLFNPGLCYQRLRFPDFCHQLVWICSIKAENILGFFFISLR